MSDKWNGRRDPEEIALELLARETARMRKNRDNEILAIRLLLAYLENDPDESAYLAWSIQSESGMSRAHFEVAARTARESARWWKDNGEVKLARTRLLEQAGEAERDSRVTDWYCCPLCARPVSPWEPLVCTRCREKAEQEQIRDWVNDYG